VSLAEFSLVYHYSTIRYINLLPIQGIPGDEGPCGEPGMTGDRVSEQLINIEQIAIYGDITGSSRSQGSERNY